MQIECQSDNVIGLIDPGAGSAPALLFEGKQAEHPAFPHLRYERFASYDSYARWIIDQHLSLVVWPREYVVQDMHLDFRDARITPLTCSQCRISGFEDFLPQQQKPFDCFVVENLRVFLDSINAVVRSDRQRES
jgi:hypothetical protein